MEHRTTKKTGTTAYVHILDRKDSNLRGGPESNLSASCSLCRQFNCRSNFDDWDNDPHVFNIPQCIRLNDATEVVYLGLPTSQFELKKPFR